MRDRGNGWAEIARIKGMSPDTVRNILLLKCWNIPKKGDFKNLFPPFDKFTIEIVFVYNGFVYNGVSFPPTIRYRQGLPVLVFIGI